MTMTCFQIGEAPARQGGGGGRSHGRGEECGHGPNMIVYRKMEVMMILMMMMCLQKYGGHHHSDPRHLIFNYLNSIIISTCVGLSFVADLDN